MDIPLPPPPGLEPALQQDFTSCSDNVSTALCEELLGTEGTPVPPYKTAIEEDVSILGNNRFSPLQFESCSVANDDEINDEPHTMVECNNKATSQLLMLRLCQSLEVIGKRLLHYLVTPFSQ